MVTPIDPKWLEILKASGWQTSALTAAFVIFIVLVKRDVIPSESLVWVTLPALGALICGGLALASIGDGIAKALKPISRLDRWRRVRSEAKMVREFIPYMTAHDRSIVGYLLYHNQKMFQHEADGGYAAPLISKGIIRMAVFPGQALEQRWVPFEIPDHIWAVLVENNDAFSYQPPPRGQNEPYPWAIHWMAK